MKNWKLLIFALAGFAIVATGCAKKSTEQASINGTGFDTVASTEDLAQLPQTAAVAQQAGVEVLPIETSPVTQGVPPIAGPANPASATPSVAAGTDAAGMAREQQIQTALKNAGLYQGAIDGKIGPASKRAIEAFQTAHGLKADGKVGPRTWAALEPYVSGAPQTATTTSADQ